MQITPIRHAFSLAAAIAAATLVSATVALVPATADPLTTLHSFITSLDGGVPSGCVAVDAKGNVYTTSSTGSANGGGAIVELSPGTGPGPLSGETTETILYSFPQTVEGLNVEGCYPYAGPILGADGSLYGATNQGGANGLGTLYSLTLPATGSPVFTLLYTFGASDPNVVTGALAQASDPDGTLFGATNNDGAHGVGGIFKFDPVTKVFTDIHDFTGGNDGAYAEGPVLLGSDGTVYGTAVSGGAADAGVVFKLSPTGAGYTITVLYIFSGLIAPAGSGLLPGSPGGGRSPDGTAPTGSLAMGPDGSLYGATSENGAYDRGTLYRLTPDTNAPTGFDFSLLHTFGAAEGDPDGQRASGGVIIGPDGSLYGTCYYGGLQDDGAVYKYTPVGGFMLLHNFLGSDDPANTDGSNSNAPLTLVGGTLYGSTETGGIADSGAVFTLPTGNPAPRILWENSDTGEIYLWNTSYAPGSGYQLSWYQHVADVGNTTWTIAGVGDVNQDGAPDIVWQNSVSGDLYDWIMQQDPVQGYILPTGSDENPVNYVATVADTSWKVSAVADITGDNEPDLIWQNNLTGATYDWLMDTDDLYQQSGPYTQVAALPAKWHLEATADITHDNVPDLIWRDTSTGNVYWWKMVFYPDTGLYTASSYSFVGNVADLDFKIVGCADIDGDGIPDLLWQNTVTGAVYYWLMGYNSSTSAYTVTSYGLLTTLDPSWRVAAFGL